jgi:hypothetical protein
MEEAVHVVPVDRYVFDTTLEFAGVLEAVYSGISRPDIEPLFRRLASVSDYSEFAELVKDVQGSAGLMRFLHLDLDVAVTLETDGVVSRRLGRTIAGNPVTMAGMTRYLGDAGSYAPVTILVEQTPHWNPGRIRHRYEYARNLPDNTDAMSVARVLDAEVIAHLRHITRES